jgi:hypothetical protein
MMHLSVPTAEGFVWTTSFLRLKAKITNAAPGVVFAILGFFVIEVTQYDVRVEPGSKPRKRKK